ncbi:hypothetical protein PVK06_005588 [Gossypium arboreum]|uniref:U-box domain-containing protein n=1 Tax=Gossypium arboreum TaxID=29729 RepID=A0ABR0QV01_GOSAR|nr:hypothetical protein PVK06_005588 [Gossypium arboreum]
MFHFLKLIKQLQHPDSKMKASKELDLFAVKNERNRKYMVEAGVPKAMLSFIVNCFKEDCVSGLEEALSALFLIRIPSAEAKITQRGINSALHVLLDACPWGRNRLMMVESGAVSALIELELGSPERRTTELILGILFHLCSCADGRAEFLRHKGGIAVVTKRIMRVSPAADDQAVMILSLISKFSATSWVVHEMLEVGTVTKLCMLLQLDCAAYLKEKTIEILRSHSDDWLKFPCIDKSVLTREESAWHLLMRYCAGFTEQSKRMRTTYYNSHHHSTDWSFYKHNLALMRLLITFMIDEINLDNHGCCDGPKTGRLRVLDNVTNFMILSLINAGLSNASFTGQFPVSLSWMDVFIGIWDQVLKDKGYDGTSSDIWSCGVILFVLMAGYLPFDEPSLIGLYKKIWEASFSCPSWFSSGARNLISVFLIQTLLPVFGKSAAKGHDL